jgi:S-adenosylmethionine-diacylglycerol 3-amino-3-carboxypropyl transferase
VVVSTLADRTRERVRSAATVLARGELRYSTVWEDHRLLERGLRVGTRDHVLAIASAGCNVLNLLVQAAPRRVIAVDLNPAQTALVELRLAGIAELERDDFLALLGLREHRDRLALYERARPRLSMQARGWWDSNAEIIVAGIEGAGRLDRFIAGFRLTSAGAAAAPAARAMFAIEHAGERARFVERELFTPTFERAFREYFSREAIARRGRDASQFAYVNIADVGGWFLHRLRWACTALPVRDNFYLRRFLGVPGEYDGARPPYLRRANWERLRALAPRVDVVTAPLERYLDSWNARGLTAAALSDVFEYLAPDDADHLFERLARVIAPGGRIAYWNLLVPRRSPPSLGGRLQPLSRLARALWQRDRAWFYGSFHVEEVCAP